MQGRVSVCVCLSVCPCECVSEPRILLVCRACVGVYVIVWLAASALTDA
jgi:hypothetical protein